jgi:hypothetical protein
MKRNAAKASRDELGLPPKSHSHSEHDCPGEFLEEVTVYAHGRDVKLAVHGRHHDTTKASAPWDYYTVSEIVPRPGGGTEILDAGEQWFDERPTVETARSVVERWDAERRDAMLSEIARQLATLDRDNEGQKTSLWRVEVVLLDSHDEVLAVGPLAQALGWIVDYVHQTPDTTDISGAASVHVQVHDSGACLSCGAGEHRELKNA